MHELLPLPRLPPQPLLSKMPLPGPLPVPPPLLPPSPAVPKPLKVNFLRRAERLYTALWAREKGG